MGLLEQLVNRLASGVIEMLIKITLLLVVISFALNELSRLYTKSLDTTDRLRFSYEKFTKGETIFLDHPFNDYIWEDNGGAEKDA